MTLETRIDPRPGSVVQIDPLTDPRWEQLARTSSGSLFVSPAWLRAINTTYGFEIEATIRTSGSGKSFDGITYCRLDDAMGRRIVSTPFCDYCDPVAVDSHAWYSLIRPLMDEGLPLQLRVTSLEGEHARALSVKSQDLRHEVGLGGSVEELRAKISPSAKRNINKARRSGVTVRFDCTSAGIDAFFALHSITRRTRHGLLAQPRSFFDAIYREFSPSDSIAVALAIHEHRVVAGIFLLEWNGRAYYKFNASDPTSLGLRPNDLLMWECLVRSRERANDLLDLGLSSSSQEGLVRYKRKYATVESPVWTLTAGPHRTPQQAELGPVLHQLTSVLVDERVPLELSERAADALYRYFT